MASTPATVQVKVDPQAFQRAFANMAAAVARMGQALNGLVGEPGSLRREQTVATMTLQAALRDARKTLDLRRDPDLVTLRHETRAYVSGRLDPWWTEDRIVEAAASWYLRLCRVPCDWTDEQAARITKALLDGWADR